MMNVGINGLRQAAVEYAAARRVYGALSGEARALMDAFLAANDALYGQVAVAKAAEVEAEAALRLAVLDEYERTGSKRPGYDLGVRVAERLEYNVERAIAWAKLNAPVFVVQALDAKPFEAYVKGVHQAAEKTAGSGAGQIWAAEFAPWVEVAMKATATLPADIEEELMAAGVTLPSGGPIGITGTVLGEG